MCPKRIRFRALRRTRFLGGRGRPPFDLRDQWVANGCTPGITRIDPATGTITSSLNAGGHIAPVALDGPTMWYGSWKSGFLGRVDTSTNAIVGQLKLPGLAFGITAAYGSVWVTLRDADTLLKIAPT